MDEEQTITVYFIKGSGNKPTASSNRHAALFKMAKENFNARLFKKEFIPNKYSLINTLKIIKFQISLIFLTIYIPKSRKNNVNVVFLLSINPIVGLGTKIICLIKANKLIIERNEFPQVLRNTNRIKKLLYSWLILPWQYKLYDGLFLMTDNLIDFYSKYTGKKCIIQKLPMTVDMQRFEGLEKEKKEKYFAYTGSLSNSKDGIIYLINAFKKVSADLPDIHLKIAGGNNHELKQLKEYVIKIGLENRVDLLGLIPVAEIPLFLVNAYALVLPRPDSKQAQGGFPTKLGEYLATGNPVIVTRVGEILNYLQNEDVFYIDPNKIEEELSNALLKVSENYEKALEIGKNGKGKAIKFFSLESNADKTAALIKLVANG